MKLMKLKGNDRPLSEELLHLLYVGSGFIKIESFPTFRNIFRKTKNRNSAYLSVDVPNML